jgi:hypothetical protein
MSRLMLVKVDYSLALNKRGHPGFADEGSPHAQATAGSLRLDPGRPDEGNAESP